jgi:acetyltransferase
VIELDINPLLVDQRGVVALDARLKVAQATATGVERFAIRPYPKELEESVQLGGRSLLLRPIRPEDEPQHARFLAAVDAQDMHMRFFHAVRSFEHAALARLTQIDYDREMAFIAVERAGTGEQETLGVVRAIADPEGVTAEFAILVRSDLKGAGLGEVLMQKLIRYCRERGIAELVGEALTQNPRMLKLARALGFDVSLSPDTGTARMRLLLRDAQPAAAASPG